MSTGFARDYVMRGRIARDARRASILGARASTSSPTTARSTRPPSRAATRPGFFSVFTGSYDVEAAHCRVTGVYTNKAPGGVAYACSFRIAEAVYLVERLRRLPRPRARRRPRRAAAARTCCAPTSSRTRRKTGWVYDSGDYERALRKALTSPATTSCAREQAEKRGARRAHGHRRLVLHRGGRRRAAQAHGHVRPGHERRRGAAHVPDRQGAARDQRADPGPGARDDVRADRRRGARHRRRTTSTSSTATPTRRRTASARTGRARRRSAARPPRSPRARCASARGSSPRRCSRSRRRTSSGRGGRWAVEGRPGAGRDDPGDRDGGARGRSSCPRASRPGSTPRRSTTRRT